MIRFRAIIQLSGLEFTWKSRGMTDTKWNIPDGQDQIIMKSDIRIEGQTLINNKLELLLLVCGLIT